MFRIDPDFPLTGEQVLAELGLDPRALRDAIEDDRTRRCPDRETAYPQRRISDLDPEWPFPRPAHAAAPAEFSRAFRRGRGAVE